MPDANDSGWASTVVVGSLTGIALTVDWLPHEVAGRFTLDGTASGLVSRDAYLAIAIGATVLLPAIAALLLRLVVLHCPDLVQLPNADYWLAESRREQTARYLARRSIWLAALISLLTFALHLLVLRANHLHPARIEPGAMGGVLVAFAAAFSAWFTHLRRHFARTEPVAQ
jgi:ABC-type Fe3+ transport system permease subunit